MNEDPDATVRVDLSEAINRACTALLYSEPAPVDYPDRADTASGRLPDAITGRKINVYALWTRAAPDQEWSLRYVGQRSVKFGERRLREHLFHVDPRTQSKLAEIRQALADGLDVGVTGILVEPDSLRLTIEDELISLAKQRGQLWNRKGGPRSTRAVTG